MADVSRDRANVPATAHPVSDTIGASQRCAARRGQGPGSSETPDARPGVIPRATYRLQFAKDFGFAQAAELAPYLAELGISHVYASPYLRARAGSTHGYDIVCHTELNPELGTEHYFYRLVAAFR
jgi:(1->4)-alpha-D-glucan 1-alpha-D-glucosylmutase